MCFKLRLLVKTHYGILTKYHMLRHGVTQLVSSNRDRTCNAADRREREKRDDVQAEPAYSTTYGIRCMTFKFDVPSGSCLLHQSYRSVFATRRKTNLRANKLKSDVLYGRLRAAYYDPNLYLISTL